MYGHIRRYFTEHPLERTAKPGASRCRSGSFPGSSSVGRLLLASELAHAVAERVLARAPRSDRARQAARDLDRFRGRLDFFKRYHSLYNEYAQSELHFVDDNTLALTRSLRPRRRRHLRLRHRRLRLEDLHRGRALPLDHHLGAADGRPAQEARRPAERR